MPIVIRELLVKANVTAANPGAAANTAAAAPAAIPEDVKVRIIEEAVQQVMEMLERQKDR
ncbi:DUF5908 family protein [Chitinophaga sp. 22321]|uniref:Uncharacterized protein n=1 Tax=Chitinophaga hostae TaxID=2831022 RepID=A0ABS5J453_9BACT|nr:DUF5908 family protein [Chitinophaga hostae]MBS0030004.1 hypothetical protein [Chitinophaga hostae]